LNKINPKAGQLATAADLVDVQKLLAAYFAEKPDPKVPEQRVAFGTSGHRGSSFDRSFNEWHILAITQAICLYRKQQNIDGPLFLGIDTHALSRPAMDSAVEVLAANRVELMLAAKGEYTPTPAVSHAILTYNRGRKTGLADGIVVTPSHNPPDSGGFKYNPPHGGPAGSDATSWIQNKANEFLAAKLEGVQRWPLKKALAAPTTHEHDYIDAYVADLGNIIDMEAIRSSGIRFGIHPLGGAGVHYWGPIAERYKLNLNLVSDEVDPTFRFMTLDWDGKIRMDPSSKYAMQSLIALQDKFDVAMACDTDHDRHGIVTRGRGLMPANHYLATSIYYLFGHRPQWGQKVAVGKTAVSSSMIDRVTAGLSRVLFEVPVGFKYFVDGLLEGKLGFVGEESAGASFLRRDGAVWTTDKDGIIAALLAAEMTATVKKDPGEIYHELTQKYGDPFYDRTDAHATTQQKAMLAKMSKESIQSPTLAGEKIKTILTHAPGDGQAIGGVKVIAESGWFAARPSGTEEIYKIYAESFRSQQHLEQIEEEAQMIVGQALNAAVVQKA
jgi:phosphoglucomutase